MIIKHYLFIALLILLSSCQSLSSSKDDDQIKITSRPDWDQELEAKIMNDDNIRRIVIVGTNDFHGSVDPSVEKITNIKGESFSYEVGGAPIIARYFDILSKRYRGELLKLDAGDMYSGTLVSNMFYGESVITFYNRLQYDAFTLGNHEFDYGPLVPEGDPQGHLEQILKKSHVPFVSSNIKIATTDKMPKWNNLHPYLLKKVNGVVVGIIGISTPDTPKVTVGNYVRGLSFNPMKESILTTSAILREKGAQVVVLLIHEGAHCQDDKESWLPNYTERYANNCEERAPLPTLLKSLPPHTVDAVVSGHSHSFMAYKYNGYPVIQSKNGGRYFGQIDLYYDMSKGKVIEEKTQVHPPVKFCAAFFDTTKDCYKRTSGGPLKFKTLTEATFLGEKIYPLEEVSKGLNYYHEKMKAVGEKVLFKIGRNLKTSMEEESEIGTLMADAIRFKLKADVGLMNSGGIRANLNEGSVTFADLYKVAPFDNYLMNVKVTGKELKNLVRIATSGQAAGIGIFSGLKIEVNTNADSIIGEDLDKDGSKEEWERNRVTSVTFSDGKPIDDNKVYNLGTNSFLGDSGGDNYAYVFKNISGENKTTFYNLSYRDALIDYFLYLNKKNPKALIGEKSYLDITPSRTVYKK